MNSGLLKNYRFSTISSSGDNLKAFSPENASISDSYINITTSSFTITFQLVLTNNSTLNCGFVYNAIGQDLV